MKYTFDKTSKKFVCPNCNKKRFVRFVDITTNEYLHDIFGKCDRETNCGYYKKPDNIHAINIASTNAIKNARVVANTNYNHAIPVNTSITTSFHTNEQLQLSLQCFSKNNLFQYLNTIFSLQEVENVFEKYKIGSSKAWHGATIFWQIDNNDKVRAGKILLLDKVSCKRVKEPYPHITWVHAKLKLQSFNLKQCLFGLHLAKNSTKIAITESEKTAVIMSLFLPEYTWLSTGSKQNFKFEMLVAIKNKEIIAFPDKNEYNDWQLKANELNKIGFKIKVSNYLEKIECKTGTDLVDIYTTLKNNESKLKDLSKDEKCIIDLAKKNCNILQLIKTFELVDSFDNPIAIEKIMSKLR